MIGRRTLALVERSLRVDTRLTRTHLIRLAFAGLILLLLARVQTDVTAYNSPGLDVFASICWLNFFLLNLAAISFFSTVITEEKEEMTLGLLRMAGISPVGMLLGKVTPRLISVVMLLSVQIPFTLLAITLGGVTIHQVLAGYSCLLAFSVMAAGVGALFSTICQRSNLAVTLTTATFGTLYVSKWIVSELLDGLRDSDWITSTGERIGLDAVDSLFRLTGIAAIQELLTTNYSGDLLSYQVVSNVVIGGVCFLLSWTVFDVFTRNDYHAAPPRGLAAFFGSRVATINDTKRVWQNAIAWKDFNFLTGGWAAIIIKLLAYSILMGGMSFSLATRMRSGTSENIGATLMSSMLTAMAVEIPIYLSRLFREELRWQTWAVLSLLPESTGRLVWNKLIGVLPTFLPALVVFAVGASFSPGFFHDLLKVTVLNIAGWHLLFQYLLGVQLVVLLSLIVKWGALPLGFSLVVIGNLPIFRILTRQLFSRGDRIPVQLVIAVLVTICLMVALQYVIIYRLKALAAE
jgi:hypothetical protein